MAITLVKTSRLKLVETSGSGAIASADATLTFQLEDETTRNASSSPDAEDGAYILVTLSSGSFTLDLTALTHAIGVGAGVSKNFNAKSIRDVMFKNPSSNSGNIRVKNGASNGFLPFGSVFDFTLPPGGTALFGWAALAAAISSTNKNLDISGTGSETLQIIVGIG